MWLFVWINEGCSNVRYYGKRRPTNELFKHDRWYHLLSDCCFVLVDMSTSLSPRGLGLRGDKLLLRCRARLLLVDLCAIVGELDVLKWLFLHLFVLFLLKTLLLALGSTEVVLLLWRWTSSLRRYCTSCRDLWCTAHATSHIVVVFG